MPSQRLGTVVIMFAEMAGFEPALPFRVYTRCRRAPSTALTPLQNINSLLSIQHIPHRHDPHGITIQKNSNYGDFAPITSEVYPPPPLLHQRSKRGPDHSHPSPKRK